MGGAWKQQPDAGVRHLGTLSEQMSAVETTEEIEGDDAVDESSEAGANADAEGSAQSGIADGSTLDGLPKGKGSKPSCPLRPVVKKVKRTVIAAARMAGKWIRRLFPKLLSAPAAEEE